MLSVEEVRVLSAAEVERALQQLDAVRRVAEASTALLLARIEAAGVFRRDGHRTPRAMAMGACNQSWADAGRLVQVGHVLTVFPSAFGLGVSQLHALAAVVANPRVQPFLADAEDLLVGQARILDYDDYVVFLTHWVNTVDPDGSAVAHERAHRERDAKVEVVGERGYLRASSGSAQAAFAAEVLAAYTDTEFMADWERASLVHGEDTHVGLLERTHKQRRADALHTILTVAAQARGVTGEGGESAAGGSGPVPTVNVVMDEATLERGLASLLGGDPDLVAPADPERMVCRTVSGIELDPRDAAMAALLGHVRRVVRNAQGVVIDVGRRQRLFTGPVREAILALQPHCMCSGCRQRAREIDHLVPWSRGGPTDASNGGPGCGHHNRWRTRGYHTCRGPDGEWHHFRPDGTEIGWRSGYLTRICPPMPHAA